MLKSVLSRALIYRLFAGLIRARKGLRLYLETHVRAHSGDRVLDIGCGPASILDSLPDVEYHGFDLSSDYIAAARQKYGGRGQFSVHAVSLDLANTYSDFDLVLATGVLHHLNEPDADALFLLAHAALKPGGRLVTIDGCFVAGQSRMARFLLQQDRGEFVRTEDGYLRLARSVFSEVESSLRTDLLRIPYTHLVMECRK